MSDSPRGYADQIAAKRKHAAPAALPGPALDIDRPAPPDDAKNAAFSTLNVAKRQPQIRVNFRLKNGAEFSLAYAYLVTISLDGGTIVLEFSGCTVSLRGRHLKKLKRRLDLHAVASIREVDEFADKAEARDAATVVYSIKREAT